MKILFRILTAFLLLTAPLNGVAVASVSSETCFGTYDTSTLHHFESPFLSQTFTDSSQNNVTWTADGNTNSDTAQKKFGSTSPYHDGTGDGLHASDSPIWTATKNTTVDFHVRFENTASARTLFAQATDANNYHELVLTGGNITYTVVEGGVTTVSYSQAWAPTLGVWYHVAWEHVESTHYKVYVDGTNLGTLTDASNPPDFTGNFYIGISNKTGSLANSMRGWIDEWRFTQRQLYFANFTPQVAAYSACATTRNRAAITT